MDEGKEHETEVVGDTLHYGRIICINICDVRNTQHKLVGVNVTRYNLVHAASVTYRVSVMHLLFYSILSIKSLILKRLDYLMTENSYFIQLTFTTR